MRIYHSTKFYDWAEDKKERYIKQVKKFVKKNNLFSEMEKIVKKYVSAFQNDFYVHDIYELNNYDGDFIWMVRNTGTDLVKLKEPMFKDGKWIGKLWYEAVVKANEYIYYYDPEKSKLTKITKEKADKIIEKYNEIYKEYVTARI